MLNKKIQDTAFFVSFCLEEYKTAKNISGEEAMEIFLKYGLIEYLSKNFEVLHTQGRQWIQEEIDEFISNREVK